MAEADLAKLPTFDGRSKLVNIVIEASKGMRTKLKYDEARHMFRAEKVLPLGLVFPFDFGFLPSTMGGDEDPLDVLVLSEEPLPWGTVVLGEVVGVLKAEQRENGQTERNDRLIAIPVDAKSREPMQPAIALDARMKAAISDFFLKYNELQHKKFKVLAFEGARSGLAVVEEGIRLNGKNGGAGKSEA